MNDFLSRLGDSELRLLRATLVVLVTYATYLIVARSIRQLARSGQLTGQIALRLRFIVRSVAVVGVVLFLLHSSGAFENAWAVLTAFLTTVAIGFFAIWSVLSNVVCAVLILIFRPFRVGDHIQLLEGSTPNPSGQVVDMNLLFVTLQEQSDDGTVYQLQIPNSLFFQKVVRRTAGTQAAPERFFA